MNLMVTWTYQRFFLKLQLRQLSDSLLQDKGKLHERSL